MSLSERARNRELYFKAVAIRNGSFRNDAPAAWKRLIHPKVGIFVRTKSARKSRGRLSPDRLKMTFRGKIWLEKIAREEAMRWGTESERLGKPVKPSEHLPTNMDGDPRRNKPKILTTELVRDLAFEWLRDDRTLVVFLESLLASYDNLSRSHYAAKVMTATAMAAGDLQTEWHDDSVLRMRIDALGTRKGEAAASLLNKLKEKIRESGKRGSKQETSPFG